jgi:hypothetical protein
LYGRHLGKGGAQWAMTSSPSRISQGFLWSVTVISVLLRRYIWDKKQLGILVSCDTNITATNCQDFGKIICPGEESTVLRMGIPTFDKHFGTTAIARN